MSLELLLGPQLEAFARAGYEVLGVSAPGRYVHDLDRRGIRHVPLHNSTRSMSPVADLRAVRELHGILRDLRPDIVHTHNPKPGVYGRVVARAARVPVIVNTVHGLYALPEDSLAKRTVVYGLERLASTCSHAELLQNPEDLPVLRKLGVPASKIAVLGNGVDLARFDPSSVAPSDLADARTEMGADRADHMLVGLVGRLVREKGYLEVFEAARSLRSRAPQLRFAVIGPDDPDKEDAISAQQRAIAEDVGVRFLGPRDDVVPLYAAMDVYVLASHREGFPRSAMEAAAMGVPIVATDIRGCRQVVDHGRNGTLVPVRDPAALADALAVLASDHELRKSMSDQSRRKALRDFDQQRCIDITLATYERLLRRAGRSAPVQT